MTEFADTKELSLAEKKAVENAVPFVPCCVFNKAIFPVRVVILAPRNGELWDFRLALAAGQNGTMPCPVGDVTIIVFNVEDNSHVITRQHEVSTSFSFPIFPKDGPIVT